MANMACDYVTNLDADGNLPEEVVSVMRDYNLTYEMIQRSGPGGGWPFIRVIGSREDIQRWKDEKYDPDHNVELEIKD